MELSRNHTYPTEVSFLTFMSVRLFLADRSWCAGSWRTLAPSPTWSRNSTSRGRPAATGGTATTRKGRGGWSTGPVALSNHTELGGHQPISPPQQRLRARRLGPPTAGGTPPGRQRGCSVERLPPDGPARDLQHGLQVPPRLDPPDSLAIR